MESLNNTPLVSIVIPAFNSANTITETIESAFNSCSTDLEIIVVDDGSTDSTVQTVKSIDQHIVVDSGPNRGAPAARNRGWQQASGKYIKFLDADDLLIPRAVDKQIAQAEAIETGRRAIVYGDAIWIDHNNTTIVNHKPRALKENEDAVLHILTNCPLTSCPLHRRDFLEEIGGFDETLTKAQEHDLHLRLVLAGVNFIYYPTPVYRYRHTRSAKRISNRIVKKNNPLEHLETIKRHARLIQCSKGEILLPIRQALARQLWNFGRGVLREGYESAASNYFAEAKQMVRSGAITGKFPYPFLVQAFGPIFAEHILKVLRYFRFRMQ